MTPTPAEIALWRALNVEPEDWQYDACRATKWAGPLRWQWMQDRDAFTAMHPADRLAYFEGKVREKGWMINIRTLADGYAAEWSSDDDQFARYAAPTEHLARFHAAARAIHALGMITDAQLKEIEGHD